MPFRSTTLAPSLLLTLAVCAACGESSSSSPGSTEDCDVTVTADDDRDAIQSAIDEEVTTGSTLCFAPGTYRLDGGLALSGAASVTFKGIGASRDDVVLDFTESTDKDGILVTTDDFTVEKLTVKNTPGNGIEVKGQERSVFRNVAVGWDEPHDAENNPLSGGYAIYPTECKDALIEDSEVFGASDAGIYAGQCERVIARRNTSHGNVLGIEIENTTGADVYENDVYGNTTGFLLDLLPNLTKKDSLDYLVHDNHVHDNDEPNFAEKNSTASSAPAGTGVLVLAAKNVEITGNDITGNDSAAVLIVSYDIIDIITQLNGGQPAAPDPETPRWPTNIYVHGNTYTDNGQAPKEALLFVAQGPEGEKTIDYDVLWDGIIEDPAAATVADTKICVGDPEKDSFLNFDAKNSGFDATKFSTDTTDHQCSLSVSPLE